MFGESRNPRLSFPIIACLAGLVGGLAADGPIGNAPPRATAMVPFALPPPTQSRVVIIEDPQATEAFTPRRDVIRKMFDRGLTNFTRTTTLTAAWRQLVSPADTVGIKVLSSPGPLSGTRPAVAEAVLTSMLEVGHPPGQVILWDRQMASLRQAGFVALAERHGVRVAASAEAGYDTNEFYASALLGQLVHGDLEFERQSDTLGRNSYVSRLVTQQMTKIISITPLLNHNLAGVSGHLFSLALGSVDNVVRFTADAGRLAVAVPEIYALPILGDRVVLNLTDALLAQYSGEERTLLHYAAVLNQLRFSADPVALDVLSLEELERQRERAGYPPVKPSQTLYRNASLVEIGTSDTGQLLVERTVGVSP